MDAERDAKLREKFEAAFKLRGYAMEFDGTFYTNPLTQAAWKGWSEFDARQWDAWQASRPAADDGAAIIDRGGNVRCANCLAPVTEDSGKCCPLWPGNLAASRKPDARREGDEVMKILSGVSSALYNARATKDMGKRYELISTAHAETDRAYAWLEAASRTPKADTPAVAWDNPKHYPQQIVRLAGVPLPDEPRLLYAHPTTTPEPSGMVLVPREPTQEMLNYGIENVLQQYGEHQEWEEAKDVAENVSVSHIYRAMLAAAPRAGGPSGEAKLLHELKRRFLNILDAKRKGNDEHEPLRVESAIEGQTFLGIEAIDAAIAAAQGKGEGK